MNKEYCRFCLQGKTGDFLRQQQTQPSALHNVITQLADWLWSLSLCLSIFFMFITLELLQKVNKCQPCFLELWLVTCDLSYLKMWAVHMLYMANIKHFTFLLTLCCCIVIDFFSNNQPDALTIQIYSVIKFYMFWESCLPIIRSSLLHIRHW